MQGRIYSFYSFNNFIQLKKFLRAVLLIKATRSDVYKKETYV